MYIVDGGGVYMLKLETEHMPSKYDIDVNLYTSLSNSIVKYSQSFFFLVGVFQSIVHIVFCIILCIFVKCELCIKIYGLAYINGTYCYLPVQRSVLLI